MASVGDINVVIGTRASGSAGCIMSVGIVCHSAGDLIAFPGVYEVECVGGGGSANEDGSEKSGDLHGDGDEAGWLGCDISWRKHRIFI